MTLPPDAAVNRDVLCSEAGRSSGEPELGRPRPCQDQAGPRRSGFGWQAAGLTGTRSLRLTCLSRCGFRVNLPVKHSLAGCPSATINLSGGRTEFLMIAVAGRGCCSPAAARRSRSKSASRPRPARRHRRQPESPGRVTGKRGPGHVVVPSPPDRVCVRGGTGAA